MTEPLDRNLGLELVRVTEAAALAAGRWMGKGAKEKADQAAVDAMRFALSTVDMDKLAVRPAGKGRVSLDAPTLQNLMALATARDCEIGDPTVVLLDRPRDETLIRQVRSAGARLKLIPDGDVAGALTAAMEDYTGADMLRGVQYMGHGARTHSLMMRSRSGTMRWIEAVHHWQRVIDPASGAADPWIWRDRSRAGKP